MNDMPERPRPRPKTLEELLRILDELIRTTPPGSPSVVMDLGPEVANDILNRRNEHNRPKRSTMIGQFSEDMGSDNFPLTGDTIKFSADGRLIDGQNRLAAVVKSGVTLRTHVVFGLDFDVFYYIDGGAGRTGADLFAIAGIPNHMLASRASRWLMIFDPTMPHKTRGSAYPNRTLKDYYDERLNAATLEAQVRRAKGIEKTLPHGQLAALLYLFEQKDPAVNMTFVGDLKHRRRSARVLLDEMDRLRRHAGNRVHEVICAALIILTWNCYRAGRLARTSQIRWLDEKNLPDID